jgi:hypothetical protein
MDCLQGSPTSLTELVRANATNRLSHPKVLEPATRLAIQLAIWLRRVGSRQYDGKERYPDLDTAVNKRDLSTGENGEFLRFGASAARICGLLERPARMIGETQKAANHAECFGYTCSEGRVRFCQQTGMAGCNN